MPDPKPKYYLTTPIYYANSRPHVGSAYTTIVCDVIARYKRMCGFDVTYLTGTDEHGVNIERAAEKLGISPADLVDRNQQIFRDLWKLLGISYTDFVRTTEPRHAIAVQNLVRRTQRVSPDAIFKRKYEGHYCIYDNLYVSDTPEPADCEICGRPAELISEENYFFRLSAYQEKLLQRYKDQPDFVQPGFRLSEVKRFAESGLKDLSISRKTIKWGIPWPGDPEHVFYVWYDALTSYMSGIGFVDGEKKDSDRFKKFWPADVHMIGKEIIRFHAVYWPAFLMAAFPDKKLSDYMPGRVQAHGWLLFEQEKMSKSKGNVAYAEPIVRALGNDALRYYLLREVVFGQDGNFSKDALITRYNADLANGLGNLSSRTLTMIENYCGGVVPAQSPAPPSLHELSSTAFYTTIRNSYDKFEFSDALTIIWGLVAIADKYLAEEKPWTLAKNPAQKEKLEGTETMENEIRNPGSTQPAAPSADSAPTAPIIAAVTGAAAAPATPAKIGIEDFAKVELRAGIVKSAERIQGADKLLKLLVDIGDEVRQVLAGIALSYAPEDLVGRKVVIVTNLAPRKMRGLESNGMLLAASVGPDGKPVLCTFAEDVPAGAKVK